MKLTKFFAFALAALAFVGCGDEPTTPAPAPEVSGSIILKASTNATTLGKTVTFTVEDTNGQDLTAMSQIYDPECMELTDKSFTAEETGTYSFFATYEGETSNTVNVRFMATMPEVPEDSDPSNLVFQHRPLLIDHTGVNCGNCPTAMDYLLKLEESEWHGKYNEVTCHAGSMAGGDPANSAAANALNEMQEPNGYPNVKINFYTGAVGNYGGQTTVNKIVSVLENYIKKNGADAGISMSVVGDSSYIYCAAQVKAKTAKEYKVVAWLLESDIYSPGQAGASKDYHKIYNYALRNISGQYSKNNVAGESVGVIEAGQTHDCAFQLPITSTKWKWENMGVLVIVSAKDANNRWEVVNSSYCKVNETKPYEYVK